MDTLTTLSSGTGHCLLILISVSFYAVYWLKKTYEYWSDRGVPFVKPITGSGDFDLIFRRRTPAEIFLEMYQQFKGHRFFGCYQLTQPTLIVRDPELVRIILVKQYSKFYDRSVEVDIHAEPMAANIFQLTGIKYKQTRQKISPVFSTMNLKEMYPSISAIAETLNQRLQGLIEEQNCVDVKDLMRRYTVDIMGACALGLKSNAIEKDETNLENIFNNIFVYDFRRIFHDVLELVSPKIAPFFNFKATPLFVERFFFSILEKTAEKKQSMRNESRDFSQILMDLKLAEKAQVEELKEKGDNENRGIMLTDDIMAANLSVLIAAGFEPTASTLAFCLFELALSPDVQEKLYAEISRTREVHGNGLEFEHLKELHYTDCVINEVLRKYPASGELLRICTESFQIPDSQVVIEKNIRVCISVLGLHRDPKYFPNPDVFNPERFSEENKRKIQPGTFMPFGDGPKNCLGMRFALIEIKVLLSTVILNYTIHPTPKTPKTLSFDRTTVTLTPGEAVWLQFQKRKKLEKEL